jgi:hypothetical protein
LLTRVKSAVVINASINACNETGWQNLGRKLLKGKKLIVLKERLRSLFWMPETGYLPNEILRNILLWHNAL